MAKTTRTAAFIAGYAVLLLFTGCSLKSLGYSGFLENYPPMKVGPSGGVDLVYLKEGVHENFASKIIPHHAPIPIFNDHSLKSAWVFPILLINFLK